MGSIVYLAYGSNLSASRFGEYLRGFDLATDECASIVGASWFSHIDLEVYLGGHSTKWGGSVAFVDPRRTTTAADGATIVRCYPLSAAHFARLLGSENGDPGLHEQALSIVAAGQLGTFDLTTTGKYDAVVSVLVDGVMGFLVTSSWRRPRGEVSQSYLDEMDRGLAEGGLSPDFRRRYRQRLIGDVVASAHR